jgi:histidine triad (HIT) family protein
MCLFCQIVAREVPANVVYENEHVLAFKDVAPVAPCHVLVVPKKHVASVADAEAEDAMLLGHILLAGNHVARMLDVSASGYRLVFNNGRDGGQHVAHIHLHVLGGRPMRWPPG